MSKTDNQKAKRRNNFARWWRKNRTRSKAHTWLAHYTRNVVYTYAMPPEQFTGVNLITKRFFNSEYKRLGQSSAWTLWKIAHPLETVRINRIQTTAAYLDAKTQELKTAKKELKNEKAYQSQNI